VPSFSGSESPLKNQLTLY